MTTHTEGPWRNHDGKHIVARSGKVVVLIKTPRWHARTPETDANANLVAMAPDMLDMLRYLARAAHIDDDDRVTLDGLIKDATEGPMMAAVDS